MAKRKKEEDPNEPKDFLTSLVGELKTLNPYAETMHNSKIYDITDWIDFGIPALNMIVSSRFDRGAPAGRIVQLYGQSQSGKSLIASYAGRNAQKKNYYIALFESEFGETKESLLNKGLDPKKTILIPIKTLDAWHKGIRKIIDLKMKKPDEKIMIITDSIGNIGSEYESTKLIEGKVDQGHRQKKIRSIFKDITIDIGITQIPFLFTNHTYENPGQAIKPKEQNISGGGGTKFMPTITVQFDLGSAIKQGSDGAEEIIGRVLKPYTVKNRVVPPYQSARIDLYFQTGFPKFTGLLEVAVKHELLSMEAGKVYIPHLPKVKRQRNGKKIEDHPVFTVSDIMDGELGDKVWLPIMDELQKRCEEDNSYFSPEIEAKVSEEMKTVPSEDLEDNGKED